MHIQHIIFEPIAVGILQAMCGRYCGVPFREWRAASAAFVGVLFASVQILNSEQTGAGQAAGEPEVLEQDLEKQVRIVRRLTGGIKSFLIPGDEHAPHEQRPERNAGKKRNKGKTEAVDEAATAIARVEANVVEAVVCRWGVLLHSHTRVAPFIDGRVSQVVLNCQLYRSFLSSNYALRGGARCRSSM